MLAGMLVILAAAPVAADPEPGCPLDGYDDRCEAWVQTQDDPDGLAPSQFPSSLVSSPDGQVVYVATMETAGSGFDAKGRWVIEARRADTGAVLWAYRDPGAPNEYAFPSSIAVSPDGSRVFVSGSRRPSFSDQNSHLNTSAFDAATGQVQWTSVYDGPGNGTDNARKVVVSPDGSEVYVATITGPGVNLDYAAVAYDSSSGAELWVSRYKGLDKNLVDSPFDVAVSQDGKTLAMTGWSDGHGEFDVDFATVAVETRGADAGKVRWAKRYDGKGFRAPDRANAVALSPDGKVVYAGGMSGEDDDGPPFDIDYRFTTIAYDAVTGEQLWESRRGFEGATMTEVVDLAVAPDGSQLYATGYANGGGNSDMVTVAYAPATGAELWSIREALPEHDGERGRSLIATANAVFVGGAASTHLTEPLFLNQRRLVDQTTTAYSPAGTKLWTARLNATDLGQTASVAMVVAGSRLVVLGQDSDNVSTDEDIYNGTIAAYDLTA